MYKHYGYCPACAHAAQFEMQGTWLRDQYVCLRCGSIPRERALMHVLERVCPSWRHARIHESSPGMRGTSLRLARECVCYIGSQYFPSVPRGQMHQGWRCEDLEALSFADDSVDIHVTQDVLEHIFDPERAFAEIARTLAPGGLHVFTTPLVNKAKPSERCARLRSDGSIEHLRSPEYHGNPVSTDGSLVTMHWGFDICEFVHRACGLFTAIHEIDAHELGIHAEFIEVMVTRKPGVLAVASPAVQEALIYGAGAGGRNARPRLADTWKIVGFVDSDPRKQGGAVDGLPVLPPSALLERKHATVFVASVHAAEIELHLHRLGVAAERVRVLPVGFIEGRS
jgi:hypothetical protein